MVCVTNNEQKQSLNMPYILSTEYCATV